MYKIPMLDLREEYRTLKTEIDEAVGRVLESGVFIGGPEVSVCEKELASFLGTKHAVSLNSGTDALVIALRSLGIGPDDEVITSSFSFFATAEAISLLGAKPIFVDIQAQTFNIDPQEIEKKITKRTKAILPVHLFGLPSNLTIISSLTKEYNLSLIEDCAQSFGSMFEHRMTGTIGDFGAYSFFPSKNLGCYGDGGLLATNSDTLAAQARKLATHGSKVKYYNEEIGYNSRLDSLQAAILRVKLKYTEKNIKSRQAIAHKYNVAFANVNGIVTPKFQDGHTYNQYTIRVKNRDGLKADLDNAGIASAIYYPIPLHKQPPYVSYGFQLKEAETAAAEALSLPICPFMKPEDQESVIACIKQSLLKKTKT